MFDKNFDGYKSENHFHVSVTNIPEFNRLINEADERARLLNETLTRLKLFYFDFVFTVDSANEENSGAINK